MTCPGCSKAIEGPAVVLVMFAQTKGVGNRVQGKSQRVEFCTDCAPAVGGKFANKTTPILAAAGAALVSCVHRTMSEQSETPLTAVNSEVAANL